MAVRKRRGNWHYRFEVDGREYTGNTGLADTSRNRTAALRAEAKARELVLAGRGRELRLQVKPFTDAAASFLAWARLEHSAKPATFVRLRGSFSSLLLHFGSAPVSSITAGDVNDYKAWRLQAHGVKSVTLRHDLHALSKAFGYWIEHNWARVNPVERVEIPSDADAVRAYVLDADEEALYFSAAAARFPALHDLGRLMLNQGCRPEEVLELRREDVDLARGYVRIRSGKSRAARRLLTLDPETVRILGARMSGSSAWLFPGKVPGARLGRLNGQHVKLLESLAICACGARRREHRPDFACSKFREVSRLGFVIYDFRHTFATRKADGGMNLGALAALLGHSNLRTVMRYVHVGQGAMDEAMKRSFVAGGLDCGPDSVRVEAVECV